VFRDPLAITIFEPDHSEEEDRHITIGTSNGGRVLTVAGTDRRDRRRIVSPRALTRAERDACEDEIGGEDDGMRPWSSN
jgi:uncharacterized DUF497 family protein